MPRGRALEGADELAADDLALLSGSLTPASASRKWSAASTMTRLRAGGGDEVALDLLGLALAQQAVVDEDAGQLVADGPLHQRRGDRGVDAAGQPADHPLAADLGRTCCDLLVDDVRRRPGRAHPGDVVQEVLEHLLPVRGVQHLGVELHAGQPPGPVLERRHRRARADGQHVEPGGRGGDRVAVAHPHLLGWPASSRSSRPPVDMTAPCGRTRWSRCARPRRRAPAPSPGSRSRCRTPARRGRTARGRAGARRRRRRWPGRRTG